MHPENAFDCTKCSDLMKIRRGCTSQKLSTGELPETREDKTCRVEELDSVSAIVLKALWCVDNSMIRASDMDAWFIQAVQYAQGERARIEQARYKKG